MILLPLQLHLHIENKTKEKQLIKVIKSIGFTCMRQEEIILNSLSIQKHLHGVYLKMQHMSLNHIYDKFIIFFSFILVLNRVQWNLHASSMEFETLFDLPIPIHTGICRRLPK